MGRGSKFNLRGLGEKIYLIYPSIYLFSLANGGITKRDMEKEEKGKENGMKLVGESDG